MIQMSYIKEIIAESYYSPKILANNLLCNYFFSYSIRNFIAHDEGLLIY